MCLRCWSSACKIKVSVVGDKMMRLKQFHVLRMICFAVDGYYELFCTWIARHSSFDAYYSRVWWYVDCLVILWERTVKPAETAVARERSVTVMWSQQQLRSQQYKSCWKRYFPCGPSRGCITRTRGLNLVAVRHTTVQMTRLPL
jgi:hypothetical protein